MRTTISSPDNLRARLVSLATQRGKKGYSDVIYQAVQEFLDKEEKKEDLLAEALKLEGSLSSEEADESKKLVKEFWFRWSL